MDPLPRPHPQPKPRTIFPPLHPDEAESLRIMRYLNASTMTPAEVAPTRLRLQAVDGAC